ncbi:C-type cyclin [Colletotrichum karsti]|uniref:RNA polymerase II holoenzyme cyclin-like subunit n=1 Tax=Colletotrichum karsti TaxID=1095194 RepID=A0A9P6LJ25_9PEZI|nr:C-type cyclin [Colletotrichum karsti]KAF9874756.1 C-type cyclin [Colletotrichum karsti]
MQFSKVLYVLFPVAVIAAPLQTFNVPTMDPNTVAPEVPVIDRRAPQAPGIIPAGMMNFNGYLARTDILEVSNATKTIDLEAGNHPRPVRIIGREDRDTVPPRLRLRMVPHPDHSQWSVQTRTVVWHAATSGGPPPFAHSAAPLAKFYQKALEIWGHRVTDRTLKQLAFVGEHAIADLPLEGNEVFFDDYTWFSDLYRPRAYSTSTNGDALTHDELNDEPGDNEQPAPATRDLIRQLHIDNEQDPPTDIERNSESESEEEKEEEESTTFVGEGTEAHRDDKNGSDRDDEGKPDPGNPFGGNNKPRYQDTQYDEDNCDFGAGYSTADEGDNNQDTRHDGAGDNKTFQGNRHGDDSSDDSKTLVDSAYGSGSSGSSDSSDDPFYLERRYAFILMAPSGPKAQQATASGNATTNNSTPAPAAAAESKIPKGPHPGHMQVSCQYTSEQRLRRMLRDNKSDPAREDSYRLQGVQLLDNVRTVLHVPVKTFDTACVYYHWFRLSFRDAEYNYQDAAMACLFLACKVEDTIKKSKELLCAAYNIKNPDHPTTQDDKMFEQPSKIVIGLERLILETIGFDFRCRYPQGILQKVTKKTMGADAKEVFVTAFDMSIDLYKTFAPIKQPTFALALGVLELTARLLGTGVDKVEKIDLAEYHTTRQSVVETMLDLLDLYTQHGKSTKLGNRFDLNKFIEVKIVINSEVDNDPKLVRYAHWCNNCDGGEEENLSNGVSVLKNISFFGSNSAKRNGRSQDGTMRFVFDPEQARRERREVEPYFKDEYEDYEVEVEVPVEPERQQNNHAHRENKRHDAGGGWGGGGGGGRRHHDRRKGRGYY